MITPSAIQIDDALWEHPLFANPATYPSPSIPLTPALLDAHIRRIRRMPSSSDQTPQMALAAVNALYARIRERIAQFPSIPPRFLGEAELLRRVRRVIKALQTDPIGPMEMRLFDRLIPDLRQAGLLPRAPSPSTTLAEALELMDTADRLLLDRLARALPATRRTYLRGIYRAISNALEYNTTADTSRIAPILAWMIQRLPPAPSSPPSYADIGCSFPTGAANTLLAERLLRPLGIGEIHGTDITPPDPVLQRNMLSRRILLYQADPLHHPLPRRYSLLLLANVHRHLAREDQIPLLRHLAASLEPDGALYLNWRFDAQNSPALRLQNVGGTLRITGEKNCA